MNSETLPLYKLIVLEMLSNSKTPLSNAQISDYILGHEYTDFLTLQQVFSDLTYDNFVIADVTENRTIYSLTSEGRQTINDFRFKLNSSIKDDIHTYLKEHEVEISDDLSIQTYYDRNVKTGEYDAELIATERDIEIIRLKLSVPSRDIAERVCQNFRDKNSAIYEYLTKELF